MPYIYLKKHPIKLITLILPHQTHLAAKNALFLPKNTPDQLITLVLPHQQLSSRAPDSTPGGKMSLETLQFSSVQSSSVQLFNKTMEQGTPRSSADQHRTLETPGSAKEPQRTPASSQLPFCNHTKKTASRRKNLCNTKHTSESKNNRSN